METTRIIKARPAEEIDLPRLAQRAGVDLNQVCEKQLKAVGWAVDTILFGPQKRPVEDRTLKS